MPATNGPDLEFGRRLCDFLNLDANRVRSISISTGVDSPPYIAVKMISEHGEVSE